MSYLMCILPTGYPTYWIFYIQFVFNLCEETISRTDEGQPRPKYIFNKCGTNIYFFTLQRFGPSPSLNFKSGYPTYWISYLLDILPTGYPTYWISYLLDILPEYPPVQDWILLVSVPPTPLVKPLYPRKSFSSPLNLYILYILCLSVSLFVCLFVCNQ